MFVLATGYGQEAGYEQLRVYEDVDEALRSTEPVHYLDLSGQKLDRIPDQVFEFKELKVLILHKNRITEVSERIGELQHLELLDLSRNRFTALPASLGDLVQLRELRVHRNNLIALPVEIGNLVELRRLIAWDTTLEEFPETLKECVKLEFVDLRVVQLSREEQTYIRSLVPFDVTLRMSAPCACD